MSNFSSNPVLLAFLQNFQTWELLIVLFVILLLFGGKRLPELARGLGRSIREFRKATHEVEDSFREAVALEESSKKDDRSTASKTDTLG